MPIYAAEGKRDYGKSDYCYYCHVKIKSKVSRHLLRMHKDRSLVQSAILARGKERSLILYKLRQLGNYQHNIQVTIFTLDLNLGHFVMEIQRDNLISTIYLHVGDTERIWGAGCGKTPLICCQCLEVYTMHELLRFLS